MPGPFDRFGQLFLVVLAGPGYPCRKYFTGFQGVIIKDPVIFVIDKFDFILTERTVFPAGEIELFLVFRGGAALGRIMIILHLAASF